MARRPTGWGATAPSLQAQRGAAIQDMTPPHHTEAQPVTQPITAVSVWPLRAQETIDGRQVPGVRRGGYWRGDGWELELALLPGQLTPFALLSGSMGPDDHHTGYFEPDEAPMERWKMWLDADHLGVLTQPQRRWRLVEEHHNDIEITSARQGDTVEWTLTSVDPDEDAQEIAIRGELHLRRSWRQSQRLLTALREAHARLQSAQSELLAATASGAARASAWDELQRRRDNPSAQPSAGRNWALLPECERVGGVRSASGFHPDQGSWCAAHIWGEWRVAPTRCGLILAEFTFEPHPALEELEQTAELGPTERREPPELHAVMLSVRQG